MGSKNNRHPQEDSKHHRTVTEHFHWKQRQCT
jgi:hypothetical protein